MSAHSSRIDELVAESSLAEHIIPRSEGPPKTFAEVGLGPVRDPVEHPTHYTSSPAACPCGRSIECIEVVQHMPFNVGNAVKYLWRLGLKGDAVEDLRKARQYIDFEIGRRSR